MIIMIVIINKWLGWFGTLVETKFRSSKIDHPKNDFWQKNENNRGFWNRSLIGINESGLKWTVLKADGRAIIVGLKPN